jgi:ferredoxin--NADP+ reductase
MVGPAETYQKATITFRKDYTEDLWSIRIQPEQRLEFKPGQYATWEDTSWQGEVGRAEDVLRKYLDSSGFEPSNTTIYLCGHPQMIENSNGILMRRGFAKESIRQEVYWVPKKEGVHLTHKS